MARGYSAVGDIIKATADGFDLSTLWDEFQQTLQIQNEARTALASLFGFETSLKGETVLQTLGGGDFEEASEYGVPQSVRSDLTGLQVGYDFKWYDLATRYTWKFLSTAPASQVQALHASALAADNRLVFKKIMNRVFSPATTANEDGTPVYGFWDGAGETPPEYNGMTFSNTHNHYLTTGGATLDAADVESLVGTVEHHGFGLRQNGDRIIVLCNPQEADVIAGYRAGVNGAKFDFIPSNDAPAFITNESIVGDRPPGQFNGLTVVGAYGDAWIVKDFQIPLGYVVALATGGANSERNPLAIRVHAQPGLQGLVQVPGANGSYPLIDSYYVRAFGVGVRQRGAGAVMQVTAGAYTAPTF
ncbi:hypothetical protein ACIRN4_23840 [Pimelobacter simplex]|uniref:hypothetical protein n=1 Tax=Nocardioides simplex TaxID=2045 RepID=UPI003807E755